MKARRGLMGLAAAAVLAACTQSALGQIPVGFHGIGVPYTDEGASSWVRAVSADGTTLAASSYIDEGLPAGTEPMEPWAWRWDSQWQASLGSPMVQSSHARALSGDGSVVVGKYGGVGYIWKDIWGDTPISEQLSFSPLGVSDDGTIVIGNKAVWKDGQTRSFPEEELLRFRGISTDNSTIVGKTDVGLEPQAFMRLKEDNWDVQYDLGYLPGAQVTDPVGLPMFQDLRSSAEAVTAIGDLTVIVGESLDSDGYVQAFRYEGQYNDQSGQMEGTMTPLGFIDTDPADRDVYSVAKDITSDGRFMVGFSGGWVTGSEYSLHDTTTAFIYDSQNPGMQSVKQFLTGRGFGDELDDWHLSAAYGISADGRVIAGVGEHLIDEGDPGNPDDDVWRQEGWVAVLGESDGGVPAPSALVGLLSMGFVVAFRVVGLRCLRRRAR